MAFRVPSIEEIYNEFYREKFFASKGFYPRSIKNFDKVLDETKKTYLARFQDMVKRNMDLIDWKIYVKACAQYFKGRFELKALGSLQGTKVYRNWVSYNGSKELKPEEVKNDILDSLKFIRLFADGSGMSLREYFLDRSTMIPYVLKHLYSGSVSHYLYAIFPPDQLFKALGDIPDDVYLELFGCTRNELFEHSFKAKRSKILGMSSISKIINKLEEHLDLGNEKSSSGNSKKCQEDEKKPKADSV